MGFAFWLIALYLLIVIIHYALFCVKSLRLKLASLLFWNGLIRVFMEVYHEAALLSVLNVHTVDWTSK